MGRARGSNAILAAAFETTYGTPPTTGFTQLPFVSGNPGEEQGLVTNDLLGYGREPLPPSPDVITNDQDIVVPVDVRAFGYWLKLLMGPASETTAGGTTTHYFTSGASVLPSMSLEFGNPEIPLYGMNFGMRANNMRIAMQRGGLLNATIGLIGQGESQNALTQAGTLAQLAIQRFSQFQGYINKGGQPLADVVSVDFTYSNNLDKIEVIRSDGRIEDADPAGATFNGTITCRFKDTVLLAAATAGTPVTLGFGWTIDAGHSLLFNSDTVYLPKPKRPITGPQGIQLAFAFQGSRSVNIGHVLTAGLVNDVASY